MGSFDLIPHSGASVADDIRSGPRRCQRDAAAIGSIGAGLTDVWRGPAISPILHLATFETVVYATLILAGGLSRPGRDSCAASGGAGSDPRMDMRKISLKLQVVALAFAIAASANAAVAADDTVVANVNGKDIVEADLSLAEAEIGGELGNLPQNVRRRVLVEYMIDNQLFAEAAEGEKLATGADFERRIAYWRQRALRDVYFEKSVRGSISEAVARGIYDDKVKGLPAEEEVQARHILVKTEDAAKALATEIGKGGDFAELASKNSEDPGSKAQGGMLGYFGRGQMVPAFEDAAFSLQKGEVSKPVQSQFGWHIIKVEDRRQKPPPSFEEVKDRLIGSMVQSKAQDIASGLRSKAKINYIDAEIKKLADEDAAKRAVQDAVLQQQMKDATGQGAAPAPVAPAPITPAP